jgi:hypothetical protein
MGISGGMSMTVLDLDGGTKALGDLGALVVKVVDVAKGVV